MENFVISDLIVILPEILIISLALVLQLVGVFGLVSNNNLARIAVIVFAITSSLIIKFDFDGSYFTNMIEIDNFAKLSKTLNLISGMAILLIFVGYNEITKKYKTTEFVTLVMIAVFGANFAVMSNNLLLLFVALEVIALPSYVLAAYNKNDKLSSEAAIKYLILGGLATCIMLFGISYIYGFSGSLYFAEIKSAYISSTNNIGLLIGITLLLVGILFKLSLAPFHFWTIDVYQGAPLMSVTLFASLAKFVAITVLYKILMNMVGSNSQFTWIIGTASFFSMIIGCVGGTMQQSIKRIIGYSTVLNMGFAVIPMLSSDPVNWRLSMTYLLIYVVANFGLLASLVYALGEKIETATLADISGLSSSHRCLSLVITIFLCSMIGVPPLVGFFAKYYIIQSALADSEFILIATMLIASVIAAYYYLNIVRHIYFSHEKNSFNNHKNVELSTVIVLTLIFVIFFALCL